jgi:hypothetical protein
MNRPPPHVRGEEGVDGRVRRIRTNVLAAVVVTEGKAERLKASRSVAHSWAKRRFKDLRNQAAWAQLQGEKALQMREIEEVYRQTSLYLKRPVTPEVAGSSPVAPAQEVPGNRHFLAGRGVCSSLHLIAFGKNWQGECQRPWLQRRKRVGGMGGRSSRKAPEVSQVPNAPNRRARARQPLAPADGRSEARRFPVGGWIPRRALQVPLGWSAARRSRVRRASGMIGFCS